MVPVRMSEENVRVNRFLALGHQMGGQPVRAGAAVENQKVAAGRGQLDARGVAAEMVRARPRSGDRPSRSPESYFHASAAPLRAVSIDTTLDTTVRARPTPLRRCSPIQRLQVLPARHFPPAARSAMPTATRRPPRRAIIRCRPPPLRLRQRAFNRYFRHAAFIQGSEHSRPKPPVARQHSGSVLDDRLIGKTATE